MMESHQELVRNIFFGKSSKIRKNTYRKIINDFKNKFKMSTKDKLKIKNY